MAIQFAAAILPSKRKLIQIGISVYRNQCVSHFIRCVNSCLEQEGANFFIEIRADGDIPKEIKQYIENALAHHNNISFKQGKEHLGTFGSYREIFSKSNSEYLCQLDADDYLAPGALESCMKAFNYDPFLSFVYTDCINIDEKGSPLGIDSHSLTPYSKKELLISFMTFHFRLVSRYKYNLVCGYDGEFRYAGDYDLCLKLSEVGNVTHIYRPLYYYRLHPNSASQKHQDLVYLESLAASQRALIRRGLDESSRISLLSNGSLILEEKNNSRSPIESSIKEQSREITDDIFYISPIEMH